MFNDLGGSVFGVGWSMTIKGPTTELFVTLGTVLGIIPAGGDPHKLGYDGLVFIKYIETPPKTTGVVH